MLFLRSPVNNTLLVVQLGESNGTCRISTAWGIGVSKPTVVQGQCSAILILCLIFMDSLLESIVYVFLDTITQSPCPIFLYLLKYLGIQINFHRNL